MGKVECLRDGASCRRAMSRVEVWPMCYMGLGAALSLLLGLVVDESGIA